MKWKAGTWANPWPGARRVHGREKQGPRYPGQGDDDQDGADEHKAISAGLTLRIEPKSRLIPAVACEVLLRAYRPTKRTPSPVAIERVMPISTSRPRARSLRAPRPRAPAREKASMPRRGLNPARAEPAEPAKQMSVRASPAKAWALSTRK